MQSRHGAIFDLDGTLIDSLDDISDSMNIALNEHALPNASREEVRCAIGDGVKTLCERLAKNLSQNGIDALVQAFARAYDQRALARTRPYDGIVAALAQLRATGVQTAVLSNKPHAFTQRIVSTLFDVNAFAAVIGAQSPAERKPSPAGALHIAGRMGLAPREIWLIGDSDIDILTARAAGMNAAAVAWGFRHADELRAARPDRMLDHPSEIGSLFL